MNVYLLCALLGLALVVPRPVSSQIPGRCVDHPDYPCDDKPRYTPDPNPDPYRPNPERLKKSPPKKQSQKELAEQYIRNGNYFWGRKEYDKAFEYYRKSYRMRSSREALDNITGAINKMGLDEYS